MKTNQRPSAAAAAAAKTTNSDSRLTSARYRSKEEELSIRARQAAQRQLQPVCERERKHEVARKEREALAQAQQLQKRDATLRAATPTPTSTARPKQTSKSSAASRTGTLQKLSRDTEKPKHNIPPAKAAKQPEKPKPQLTKINSDTFIVEDGNTGDTAQLRLQLEHLTQLSDHDFEREFRKWLSQEGIDNKMHAHLRMHLINCFNSTSLGKLLSKATTTAAQSKAVNRTPMTLALHTLVAEFLYEQNCHYTLSVFCSEMQHHHALPNFQGRTEFRFNWEEVQQVLAAVLGKPAAESKSGRRALHHYGAQSKQSLLLVLVKALLETSAPVTQTVEVQTEPAVCLGANKTVDTGKLYKADDLIVAGDGCTVFIGPHASKSLTGLGQHLRSLMQNINSLSTPCAPPIEVISNKGLKKMLQQELLERQRLLADGKTLEPGKMATQLPSVAKQSEEPVAKPEDNIVLSSVGPIVVPAASANVPKLPHLHEEQVATIAMMQHTLQRFQQQIKKQQIPEASMRQTLACYEALVCELSVCVHTLGNVLNLTMEQECVVGKHRGYKRGYHEGFSHGHFMGVQEGKLRVQQQQQLQRHQELRDVGCQTPLLPETQTVGIQTEESSRRNASQSTDCSKEFNKTIGCQTTPVPVPPPVPPAVKPQAVKRTYIQWVLEMMSSESGNMFLEHAEESMQKALTMQKDRLEGIYMYKLRQHAEILRLHYRESCWRSLCRNLELDSHSSESRELVPKIIKILERYEREYGEMAEQLKVTEQAVVVSSTIDVGWPQLTAAALAEAKTNTPVDPKSIKPAGRLVVSMPPPPSALPVQLKQLRAAVALEVTALANARKAADAAAALNASSASNSTAPAADRGLAAMTLPAPAQVAAPAEANAPANAYAPPVIAPVQVAAPVPVATLAPAQVSAPIPVAASAPVTDPAQISAPVQAAAPVPVAAPAPILSPAPIFASATVVAPAPPAAVAPVTTPAAVPAPAPPAAAVPVTTPAAVPTPTLTPTIVEPPKPKYHDVATNTTVRQRAHISPVARSPTLPSFTETLLSAKSRMQQLEKESDQLEQSFLNYLEGARVQKQKQMLHIRNSCARERKHIHRTLESFRDWQRRMRHEDQCEPLALPRATASNVYSASELAPQESYQFTNAITDARRKLFSELQATPTPPAAAAPAQHVDLEQELLVDQVQSETQLLLHRVEQTLARVGRHPSLQLLTAESQMPLYDADPDLLSSDSTLSGAGIDAPLTPPPSHKLQRSMARMEQLFAGRAEAQTTIRPWSAPTLKRSIESTSAIRPHTAPSRQMQTTDTAAAGSSSVGMMSESSLNTRPTVLREVYGHLVDNATSTNTSLASSSSSSLSHSVDFWKRMNL